MRRIFKEITNIFVKLMFDSRLNCCVIRAAAAFGLAFLVVFDPFSAVQFFRIYLYVFSAGMLLLALVRFKFERKIALLFLAVFAVGASLLYFARGDSVSGIGIALLAFSTAVTLFCSCSRRLDRYNKLMRIVCGVFALLASAVIIAGCGDLGVRYLDQLHSCSLVLAGCGFSNILLIKRGDI